MKNFANIAKNNFLFPNTEKILLCFAEKVAWHCLPELLKKQLVKFATQFLNTLQVEQTKPNTVVQIVTTQQ